MATGMEGARMAQKEKRPTGFLVGPRSQVQTSTVEIDRVDEVLFVAKSSSGIFHPLNFGVDGFAGGVGNRMG